MRALTTQESPDFSHGECQKERINELEKRQSEFEKVKDILMKKYLFWKDKFINEFGYTFEDRGFGGMTYTMDVLRKLNKNI